MHRRRRFLAPGLVALGLLAFAQSSVAQGSLQLCALRDGPRGPCTCKGVADGPGQFTVVPKSRCRVGNADSAAGPVDAGPKAVPVVAEPGRAAAAPAADTAHPSADATPSQTSVSPAVASASGGKLEAIRQRGRLLCGVNTGLLGFSIRTDAGVWTGLDTDFCRALAAAVFGEAEKVEFVALETAERFDALKAGKVDVLARNTTWTMEREVDLGVSFAGVLYYDGQGFMTSDERGFVSAQQLSGSKVCVEAGTTSEKNMAYFFKAHDIEAETLVQPTREEMLKSYAAGTCDSYTGDRSALFSDRATFPDPQKHTILPEVISKEPLGPAVAKGDDEWSEIVRWTLAGLINAEEVGLDKAAALSSSALTDDAARLVEGADASGEKLHLSKSWLRNAVAAVGNYGEIFEVNVGKGSPLGMERGLNALWKRGGILIAPPMW